MFCLLSFASQSASSFLCDTVKAQQIICLVIDTMSVMLYRAFLNISLIKKIMQAYRNARTPILSQRKHVHLPKIVCFNFYLLFSRHWNNDRSAYKNVKITLKLH